MKRSLINIMLMMGCCLIMPGLSQAKNRNKSSGVAGATTSNSDENFPDYTQPTTRFVTSGDNLRRTRMFGLSEQMARESMGIQSR